MAKSNGSKVTKQAAIGLAIVLGIAALATSITALVLGAKKSGWFEKSVEEPAEEQTEEAATDLIATPYSTDRMALSIKTFSATDATEETEETDDAGIAAYASGYTISATVYDENGDVWEDMQAVTFSLAWASTNSGTVTDYVSMSVDGTTATVSCLKAFGTQIIVTCKSTLVDTVKATTTLDYRKKVESVTLDWKGTQSVLKDGSVMNVDFYTSWASGANGFVATSLTAKSVAFGTGSVSDSANAFAVTISSNTALDDALKALGMPYSTMVAKKSDYTYSGPGSNLANFTASEYNILSGIYGTDRIYPNSSIRSNFLKALGSVTNQFSMTIKVTTAAGLTTTFNTTLNVSVETTTATSITLSGGGYIF